MAHSPWPIASALSAAFVRGRSVSSRLWTVSDLVKPFA
jgi:hypothetical protein